MSTTPYNFGDILLLKAFPYSNLDGVKKRPAVLLADTGDQDIILAQITSQPSRDSHDLALDHWKNAGLLLPSCIRLSKIATLNKKLVLKKLGILGSPERRKVRTLLKNIFKL